MASIVVLSLAEGDVISRILMTVILLSLWFLASEIKRLRKTVWKSIHVSTAFLVAENVVENVREFGSSAYVWRKTAKLLWLDWMNNVAHGPHTFPLNCQMYCCGLLPQFKCEIFITFSAFFQVCLLTQHLLCVVFKWCPLLTIILTLISILVQLVS